MAADLERTLHDLQTERDRVAGLLEARRQLVADVSHELRSPLTGLRAQLEVALERPKEEDWPAVARASLKEADRLQRIVADLLLMARLEAGVQIDRRPVDLVALAREEVARRGLEVPIELEAEEEPVEVLGSADHLHRLLINLLDNAEHYARSRVSVTVRTEAGDAVLEVADDGPGIAPDDRERIFLRFQRAAGARRREHGGTGLGLPISRDIAIAHGGTLRVADVERGARLVLRLPLAHPERR
jgi:signal transduction histidine kinase